jgi:triacylglycerol lipase
LVPGAFVNQSQASRLFLAPDDYFKEYRAYFSQTLHCEVEQAQLPPDATIEEQGLALRDQLQRWSQKSGGARWVLIAHSQGGLDARYALKVLGLKNVDALVTIGTPHHGADLAEWSVKQRERGSWFYWALRVLGGYDLRALSFLGEMTPEFLKEHEASFEPVPGVRYFSAQGNCQSDCHFAFKLLDFATGASEKRSGGDGILSRETQRFGEDLGDFNLDHISEVGADAGKSPERARFFQAVSEKVFAARN